MKSHLCEAGIAGHSEVDVEGPTTGSSNFLGRAFSLLSWNRSICVVLMFSSIVAEQLRGKLVTCWRSVVVGGRDTERL